MKYENVKIWELITNRLQNQIWDTPYMHVLLRRFSAIITRFSD